MREEISVKTISDLSLRENEKKAIREATRSLKRKFPVEEVILFIFPRGIVLHKPVTGRAGRGGRLLPGA